VDFIFIGIGSSEVPFASLVDYLLAPIGSGRFALSFGRTTTNDTVWTIQQTGTIPSGIEYVAYAAEGYEMEMTVNGQPMAPLNPPFPGISPFGYSGYPTNLVYSVAGFSGSEVQLAFVGPFGPPPVMGIYDARSYLDSLRFASAPPRLSVNRAAANLVIGWPGSTAGYVLQSSASLTPGTWQDVPITPVASGNERTGTVRIGTAAQFYRLGLAAPKSP
jgi:hypothetical protein